MINGPKDMSPLEAVTHLCAAIQLADGQTDYEERQAWLIAIKELFPEFSEDRADKFLMEAQTALNQKTAPERMIHISDVLQRIRSLLNEDQIKKLSPKISDLIEADGIIMTSEMDIARLIEEKLDIKIKLNDNL
jgi:uncharacterized tellurite resistance protein B-like protein